MIEFDTRIGPGFTTTPTFEAMRFPAGEAHVKVVNDNAGKGDLLEVARIHGADGNDLFALAMWADAAARRGSETALLIPYLPGARQDRGEPFGAEVYAQFLNSMALDTVIYADPHSSVMADMLLNGRELDVVPIIRNQVIGRADRDTRKQAYAGIIAPDAGAVPRAQRVAHAAHLPLYRATKHRDPLTGKLSHFEIEDLPAQGRLLVVDDICDGGGTFVGLAEAAGIGRERLGLYVTHGIFSAGAERLVDHYSEIVSTDSYWRSPHRMLGLPGFRGIYLHPYLIGALS